MTLFEIRTKYAKEFNDLNIDINDLDCILMESLNITFTDLHFDRNLSQSDIIKIEENVARRKKCEPITKIFNKAYFYGYEFYVNKDVLSPRPETEILVDKALEFLKTKNKVCKVLDMCTGSGAIACAISKNIVADITAVDVSEKALNVANLNAKKLNCGIKLLKSDMFENVFDEYDLIVSNPPYIPVNEWRGLELEVKKFDPEIALVGGEDGLKFYKIIKNNMDKLVPNGELIMEIGYNQGKDVLNLFNEYQAKLIKDYNNQDRVVVVKNIRIKG